VQKAPETRSERATRRIRVALGMGLLWGAAWSLAGIAVARMPGFNSDLPFPMLFAPFGFATGVVISAILAAIERRRSLDRLSHWRVAACGALSGVVLSTIFAGLRGDWRELLVFAPALGVASAGAATASLAVATRSEPRRLGE
jgi:drug/metabolite transporter (DMT)-like permease